MANPLLGFTDYRENTQDGGVEAYGVVGAVEQTAPSLAIILLFSLGFIVVLRKLGFRAMIAVGRGG